MATMTIGNLSALGQNNVKRMLAYSSIAHAGLHAARLLACSTRRGIAAILFYIVDVLLHEPRRLPGGDGGGRARATATRPSRHSGARHARAVLAVVMAIFLFSLTGLPPFAGFVGKFYIFSALLSAGGSWNWIARRGRRAEQRGVALLLRARPPRDVPRDGERSRCHRSCAALRRDELALAVPTLVLGVYWGPVYDFVARSLVMAR